MTTDIELRTLSSDLVALEAIVRALTHVQARRSPTALGDLLQAMSNEATRLRQGHAEGGVDAAAHAVVEGWIEHIKDEAIAA